MKRLFRSLFVGFEGIAAYAIGLIFLTGLLGGATSVSAGTLTMVGDGGLEVTSHTPSADGTTSDEYRVKGTYTIENRGTEIAKEVFPQFRIGQWQWSGSPKTLPSGQKGEWEVDVIINQSQLRCKDSEPCGQLDLPMRGAFPLYILRHYQDLNGYRFSAPDISRVTVGDLTPQEVDRIQVPSVEANMVLTRSDGDRFEADLTVLNLGDEPVRVAIAHHHTREIRTTSEVPLLDVTPDGRGQVSVSWTNFKGLEGSSYATFVILQWDAGGVRTYLPAGVVLSIHRVAKTPYFLWGSMAALIIFGVILWAAVRRPSRAKVSPA